MTTCIAENECSTCATDSFRIMVAQPSSRPGCASAPPPTIPRWSSLLRVNILGVVSSVSLPADNFADDKSDLVTYLKQG